MRSSVQSIPPFAPSQPWLPSLPHPPYLPYLPLLLLLSLWAAPASAQRLPTTVRPSHYTLAFDVDLADARFNGDETIAVELAEASNRLLLNAVDITFREVTIEADGRTQKASVTTSSQMALLTVPRAIPSGPALIRIKYSGTLNDELRGFYLSRANGRRYAVSQMESTDARRAFPSFDEPAFKATFDITLTVDRGDTAISNGRVLSDTPGPGANRHTLKFSTTPKMSSYLVALAVGDFECLEGSSDGIPIRVCATPDKTHLGRLALGFAGEIVSFYNRYYDIKYPFGKIDLLAVPDFAAGAMENTAAIFYRETDLLADERTASIETQKRVAGVLAHEMAHQWFGDLVTMAWWDDLWLNEGFATWIANRPLAAMKPEWNIGVDEALETQAALELDSLASTRPIHATVETPTEIEASFDTIAYEKGGAVLRMVESFIGPEAFRTGVNAYLAKHAYGNATSEDFWAIMAASSGRPLDRVFSTFVSIPGAPLLTPAATCSAGQATLAIAQERFMVDASQHPSSPGRWEIPVCGKTDATAGTCQIVPPAGSLRLGADAGCPEWIFMNAGANGYYRTSYERDALAAMAPHVNTALTAPERLSLLGDEWALVRAGRHPVGDFLTLAAGFGHESSSGVFAQLAERLSTVRTYLTTPETRPRLETIIRKWFGPLSASLGANTIPGEAPETTALRAEVQRLVGGAGGDQATLEYARRAVNDALAGRAPLEPTAADAQVALAAQHGDAALFDALATASQKAATPEERYRYLYALTSFTDPALVQRGLMLSLGSELRSQDTPTFLAKYLANPSTNAAAWTFVKTHWKVLEPKVVNFLGDISLTRGLGSFCDPESRADFVAFFKTHRLPTGQRTLAQSVNRIDNCIALKKAQTGELTKWLERESR